ncbi:MAG: hypothetical protein JOZ27_03000, partial [Caulobacteraceae bacterium]|nr:hypothetical protein [Caulobacteraceae bacterium]
MAMLSRPSGTVRKRGDAKFDAEALDRAVAAAIEQLSQIADKAEEKGADIIAFQIAMLEDRALAEPAYAGIEAGLGADEAWRRALDRQVADYESSTDELFRARSSDLSDIRDRVLAALAGAAPDAPAPAGAILIGEDLTPSRFLSIDWSRGGGVALTRGSASSHVATLARSQGVPMIVGVPLDLNAVPEGTPASIDGGTASLWLNPAPATLQALSAREGADQKLRSQQEARRLLPAATSDGEPVAIYANIADLK